MNTLFLTAIIFTVALVQGGQTAKMAHGVIQPCQKVDGMMKYVEFVRKHILEESFNREDLKSWESYLVRKQLCSKTQTQSFIDGGVGQVQQICRGDGWRVIGATGSKGNLCISKSPMDVYDVSSMKTNGICKVVSAIVVRQPVVVACNKVNSQCFPVHYEKYFGQSADDRVCM